MQRKEKRSGGLSLKKFFKSITKPNGNGNGNGHGKSTSPRAVLPSGDNQFAMAHHGNGGDGATLMSFRGNNSGTAPAFMQRSPPKTNYVSGASHVDDPNTTSNYTSPQRTMIPDANVVRWGGVLSRIPKLVNECINVANNQTPTSTSPTGSSAGSPSSSGSGSDPQTAQVDLTPLLESLRQMATKEYQAQILQYYMGQSAMPYATSGLGVAVATSGMTNMMSNWEQRKVFKQCRRSLLLCWKFVIAQLNDERVHKTLSSESRDTYYQLLGLIAERIEFNLLPDPRDGRPAPSSNGNSNGNSSSSRPPASKARSASQSGSSTGYVSSVSPSSSASTLHNFDQGENNNATSDESGNDVERDIYLYRCLLVATFKHVIESIDAANAKRRAFISFAESQFFAKVLAICFFRIPVVQRTILDGVYAAYRGKRWTKTTPGTSSASVDARPGTPSQAYMASRLNRRRSSSKPWNSMTFEGTLARWSEFEGQMLQELNDDSQSNQGDVEGKVDISDKLSESSSSESSDNNNAGNPFAPPSRVMMDKFKRQNPTLFRWTRYSPYIGPYADSDVFRTHEADQAGWLLKLTLDGEFFSSFMVAYVQHAEFVSVGEPVWYCLPGYTLLMRVSMLLVKEAAWQKWLLVRDTTDNIVTSHNGSNQDDRIIAFEVKAMRSVKTVLDGVVHLLKNRDALESCVLAIFETTNVLNAKSVSTCLTRLEEWFAAAAVRLGESSSGEMSYRLPANYHGQALGTAVRMMLCSESFEILNRVLLFLYNRMDYFDGELRQNILKAVVPRHMFLFLHWNADVRNTYHHLLVYKIVRTNRYLLDSTIDQLLVGRFAMLPMDANAYGRDDNTSGIGFDDTDGMYDEVDNRPVLSAAEFNILRLEQALWRAFDACLAAICVQERRHARDANRKYQIELQAAQSRSVAFQKLTLKSVGDDEVGTNPNNEGLPGGKASHELDLLTEELSREPPYYLRYLPAEEVSSLDELRRLAQSVKYPPELQVYATISLRGYSDLLKLYFHELRQRGYAEAPPLGFN